MTIPKVTVEEQEHAGPKTEEEQKWWDAREVDREKRKALLESLDKRLQIPIGYTGSVYKEENDWSFIIKLAVLAEAAVTHALVLHLKNDQLYDHFADVSNYKRLELALTLGIIEKSDKDALDILASVRNSFAHNVKNLDGSLENYFLSLHPERQVEIQTKLARLEGKNKPKVGDDMKGHAQFFKLMVYAAVVRPLLSIATQGQAAQREQEQRTWDEVGTPKTLADLFRKQENDTPLVMKAAAKRKE